MGGDCERVDAERDTLRDQLDFRSASDRKSYWRASAVVCFFLALCVVPTIWGQQGDERGTAASIRALEREWTIGQSREDAGALDLIFDNALVYVEYGRLVSKGEYLARIKRQTPQIDQITYEGATVRIFGGTALCIGTYTEKKIRAGKSGAKRWRFIDTWVYKNGGWVLVAAAAAPLTK